MDTIDNNENSFEDPKELSYNNFNLNLNNIYDNSQLFNEDDYSNEIANALIKLETIDEELKLSSKRTLQKKNKILSSQYEEISSNQMDSSLSSNVNKTKSISVERYNEKSSLKIEGNFNQTKNQKLQLIKSNSNVVKPRQRYSLHLSKTKNLSQSPVQNRSRFGCLNDQKNLDNSFTDENEDEDENNNENEYENDNDNENNNQKLYSHLRKYENNKIIETNEDELFEEPKIDTVENFNPKGKKKGYKNAIDEGILSLKTRINFSFEDIRSNYKYITYEKKGNYNEKERGLENLYEIQYFPIYEDHVWVMKPSHDGNYLALGCKSGSLKILLFSDISKSIEEIEEKIILNGTTVLEEEAFNKEKSPLIKVFDEEIYREYLLHDSDIIDVCWSNYNTKLLLSAGCDNYVCLIDIVEEGQLKRFKHKNMVTGIAFLKSTNDNYFITGCFDKILRIYRISDEELINYINVQEYITSMCLFPNESQLIIGTHLGKCEVYDIKSEIEMKNENLKSLLPKKYYLQMNYTFEIENNKEKSKITSIEFINKEHIIVTVNDSIIRLIKISNGQVLKEFKGNKNCDTLIKSSFDEIYNYILSSSDDGKITIWSNNKKERDLNNIKYKIFVIDGYESISPLRYHDNDDICYNITSYNEESLENQDDENESKEKQRKSEIFTSRTVKKELNTTESNNKSHLVGCSIFLKDKILADYCEKVNSFYKDIHIKQVIVNSTNRGYLQILLNYKSNEFLTKKGKLQNRLNQIKNENRFY